ncbi:uncharacterized protein LOC111710571 isoform X2 [Eurytemora carolleeae]|nr:uncharacterized protein LOC111710571 isoform X2 [Eurytemora carolleeae]|eukprot:XP_023340447.1 uncharacterized protein LOC111710571 isoform X2 [Eurytemora affinis]
MEEKEQFNQDMAESSKVYSLENIWIGLKRKRRDVVFDTPIQNFHSDSQIKTEKIPKYIPGYVEGPHPIISDPLFSLIILIYVAIVFLYMFYAFCWKDPEPQTQPQNKAKKKDSDCAQEEKKIENGKNKSNGVD